MILVPPLFLVTNWKVFFVRNFPIDWEQHSKRPELLIKALRFQQHPEDWSYRFLLHFSPGVKLYFDAFQTRYASLRKLLRSDFDWTLRMPKEARQVWVGNIDPCEHRNRARDPDGDHSYIPHRENVAKKILKF